MLSVIRTSLLSLPDLLPAGSVLLFYLEYLPTDRGHVLLLLHKADQIGAENEHYALDTAYVSKKHEKGVDLPLYLQLPVVHFYVNIS